MRNLEWFLPLLLAITLASTNTAAAQSQPYTPVRGSVERTAIMDALRPPIQRAIREPLLFTQVRLHVQNGWAFVQTVPTSPSGGPVMWRYNERVDCGENCTDNVVGLLRWNGARWVLVQYEVGSSEYPYMWERKYPAPRGIFPWNRN